MAKTATKAQAKPATSAATKSTADKVEEAAAKVAQPKKTTPAEPKKSTALATQKSAPPASAESLAQLPAHMRGDVDMGKDAITTQDMDIPRLKLIQGTSKELTLYDDLRAGHFFHTATETIFDEAFRVVPIYFDKQYILWRPLEDGGGILARASDGVNWSPSTGEFEVKLDRKDGGHKVKWKLDKTVQGSGLANWGTMNPNDTNSPPAATLMYNFLLAFPDYPDLMPAVLTFQRSSIKIGRKFMTKLKTVRTPLFGSIFSLSAIDDHNSANQDYKNISMVGAGLVTDPEMYDTYKSLHMSLAKTGLNIRDIDSLQGDPEVGGDAAEGASKPAY